MDDINKIIKDLANNNMLHDSDGKPISQDALNKLANNPKYKRNNNNSGSNSVASADMKSTVSDIIAGATLQQYAPEDTNVLAELVKNYKAPTDGGSTAGAVFSSLIKTAMDGIGDYVKEQSYLLTFVNKELGLAGELSQKFRESVTRAQPDLKRMGIPFKEMSLFFSFEFVMGFEFFSRITILTPESVTIIPIH